MYAHAKVDHVNHIAAPSQAHQEVVWFDVSMNNLLEMKMLDTTDELIGKHQHGFQRERAAAESQKIFQARPKQFQHHVAIIPIFVIREHAWKAYTTGEFLTSHDFIFEP